MNMIQALGQAIRIPELRRKLLFTLMLLLIFRVLASISVPGANPQALQQLFANNSLLGLLNLFSGGGLSTFSVAAMGMNPYINATIIMQLMTVVSLRLKELSKEGEQGRKRITRYTRWLTVALAALQAYGYTVLFTSQGVLSSPSAGTVLSIIITLTAGSIILMWLGELITEYGVGNGVSLVIFSGIIGRLPGALYTYGSTGGTGHVLQLIVMAVVAISVTAFIIEVQQAQRKIPIQSAQRVVNPRAGQAVQGRRSFLPLRVNAGGVIPIIFAISIMAFPTIFSNFFRNSGGVAGRLASWITTNWQPNGPSFLSNIAYNGIEFMLVLGFTYFYTAVVFDPNDVADDFKKRSVYIPGIRPGKWTADYLGKVMGRITLAGALFLAVITVVLPLGTSLATGVSTTSLYLGGTAILIVVGVALDTMQQIETQLLMRQYKGFIK
ncbi:MAG TPA: preprotein translocase subunit SecY [Candidatus Dormibacteraeota bacterium]|jgi:preprotein translocase subunit SecY|nr:preprotein translocase subunit SecY [Candidatus Dormibacteraeota bacterium]